ncbi:hypothetical protein HDU76_005853, partial [Blyttiomyces sp. JEL0837]
MAGGKDNDVGGSSSNTNNSGAKKQILLSGFLTKSSTSSSSTSTNSAAHDRPVAEHPITNSTSSLHSQPRPQPATALAANQNPAKRKTTHGRTHGGARAGAGRKKRAAIETNSSHIDQPTAIPINASPEISPVSPSRSLLPSIITGNSLPLTSRLGSPGRASRAESPQATPNIGSPRVNLNIPSLMAELESQQVATQQSSEPPIPTMLIHNTAVEIRGRHIALQDCSLEDLQLRYGDLLYRSYDIDIDEARQVSSFYFCHVASSSSAITSARSPMSIITETVHQTTSNSTSTTTTLPPSTGASSSANSAPPTSNNPADPPNQPQLSATANPLLRNDTTITTQSIDLQLPEDDGEEETLLAEPDDDDPEEPGPVFSYVKDICRKLRTKDDNNRPISMDPVLKRHITDGNLFYQPRDPVVALKKKVQLKKQPPNPEVMECQCGKKFRLSRPEVIQQMPREVQEAFPCVLSHRGGVSLDLLRLLEFGCDNSTGPTAIHNKIKENYTLQHTTSQLRYYASVTSIVTNQRQQPTPLEYKVHHTSQVPLFSPFSDKNGYAGVVPSGGLNVTHSLARVNGVKTFNALASIKNEYSEIRFQKFTMSTSMNELKYNMDLMRQSMRRFGAALPGCIWVDNCCHVAAFWRRVFPSLVRDNYGHQLITIPEEAIQVLPSKGDRTIERQTSVVLDDVLRNLNESNELVPIGLDTEWRVKFELVPDTPVSSEDTTANPTSTDSQNESETDATWTDDFPDVDINEYASSFMSRKKNKPTVTTTEPADPSSNNPLIPGTPSQIHTEQNNSTQTTASDNTTAALPPPITPPEQPKKWTSKKDGRVCLIQLAISSPNPRILLFQFHKKDDQQSFPDKLREVLQHPKGLFIGRSIKSVDTPYLSSDWGVHMREDRLIALEDFCFDKGWTDSRGFSLDNLTRAVLKASLDKDPDTRLSDWSTKLSPQQRVYAARDCWASLKIYEKVILSEPPPEPLSQCQAKVCVNVK